MIKPLDGLRIVDFTWVGAGPFTTKIFADFGAEVIKIESTTRPDQLRRAEPLVGNKDLNSSGYFANRNTNKKSITLNMKHPESKEIILELVKNSDIIINSFTPNTMDKFGLSFNEVKKVKEDIIYLSMPMQGNWGPHKDFLGFGSSINALAGITYLTSELNGTPMGTGTNYPDHIPNPCHAAFALFAALEFRKKTGFGQNIELAQNESTLCIFPDSLMEYSANKVRSQPTGNNHPLKVPYGVYPCKGEDRWCAISVSNDQEWSNFCSAIECVDIKNRYQTLASRSENKAIIDKLLTEWTMKYTAEYVMETLQQHGVSAGVVQNAKDILLHDPNLKQREFWQRLQHPVMGETVYHGVPFRFSEISNKYKLPAPLIGENNEEVIKGIEKYSTEWDRLIEDGVIK
jgi:benzylsuccinate CoA-transferase BbsF subunit